MDLYSIPRSRFGLEMKRTYPNVLNSPANTVPGKYVFGLEDFK